MYLLKIKRVMSIMMAQVFLCSSIVTAAPLPRAGQTTPADTLRVASMNNAKMQEKQLGSNHIENIKSRLSQALRQIVAILHVPVTQPVTAVSPSTDTALAAMELQLASNDKDLLSTIATQLGKTWGNRDFRGTFGYRYLLLEIDPSIIPKFDELAVIMPVLQCLYDHYVFVSMKQEDFQRTIIPLLKEITAPAKPASPGQEIMEIEGMPKIEYLNVVRDIAIMLINDQPGNIEKIAQLFEAIRTNSKMKKDTQEDPDPYLSLRSLIFAYKLHSGEDLDIDILIELIQNCAGAPGSVLSVLDALVFDGDTAVVAELAQYKDAPKNMIPHLEAVQSMMKLYSDDCSKEITDRILQTLTEQTHYKPKLMDTIKEQIPWQDLVQSIARGGMSCDTQLDNSMLFTHTDIARSVRVMGGETSRFGVKVHFTAMAENPAAKAQVGNWKFELDITDILASNVTTIWQDLIDVTSLTYSELSNQLDGLAYEDPLIKGALLKIIEVFLAKKVIVDKHSYKTVACSFLKLVASGSRVEGTLDARALQAVKEAVINWITLYPADSEEILALFRAVEVSRHIVPDEIEHFNPYEALSALAQAEITEYSDLDFLKKLVSLAGANTTEVLGMLAAASEHDILLMNELERSLEKDPSGKQLFLHLQANYDTTNQLETYQANVYQAIIKGIAHKRNKSSRFMERLDLQSIEWFDLVRNMARDGRYEFDGSVTGGTVRVVLEREIRVHDNVPADYNILVGVGYEPAQSADDQNPGFISGEYNFKINVSNLLLASNNVLAEEDVGEERTLASNTTPDPQKLMMQAFERLKGVAALQQNSSQLTARAIVVLYTIGKADEIDTVEIWKEVLDEIKPYNFSEFVERFSDSIKKPRSSEVMLEAAYTMNLLAQVYGPDAQTMAQLRKNSTEKVYTSAVWGQAVLWDEEAFTAYVDLLRPNETVLIICDTDVEKADIVDKIIKKFDNKTLVAVSKEVSGKEIWSLEKARNELIRIENNLPSELGYDHEKSDMVDIFQALTTLEDLRAWILSIIRNIDMNYAQVYDSGLPTGSAADNIVDLTKLLKNVDITLVHNFDTQRFMMREGVGVIDVRDTFQKNFSVVPLTEEVIKRNPALETLL